ncbi:MAG: PQQ-binding-like beta-propeller repeat protein [Bryobacterales bacterium]|nr:PQQ-binding-like beta-propeller repeat protein [Bryobacterales bacterium]
MSLAWRLAVLLWGGAIWAQAAGLAAPLSAATLEWSVNLGAPAVGPAVSVGAVGSTSALAVALANGRIAVYSPEGAKLREMRLDLGPGSSPVSDGRNVYAADVFGSVYCFDESGARVWKYSREDWYGSGYNNLVLADIDGDGMREVLVATQRGNLYAIDSHGAPRFELKVTNFRLSSPAVGDVNGDGLPDIVFSNDDGEAYCVNGKGDIEWVFRVEEGRFGRTLPVIADADKDGRYEVYFGTPFGGQATGIYALDGMTGKLRWRAKSLLQTYNSIVVADLNHDGRNEILYGDKNTRVFAVDGAGKPLWDRQLDGNGIFFAGAVADLEGGRPLLLQMARGVGANGKSLYALDGQGAIVDAAPVDRAEPHAAGGSSSPLLCRFRGTSSVELVVTAGGKMLCYRPPQKPGARILWPGARNDAVFSGFVPSTAKTPVRAAGRSSRPAAGGASVGALAGKNQIAVPQPPAHAMASVRIIDPGGAVHLTFLRKGDAMAANFTADRTGSYRATVQWIDTVSARTLRSEEKIYVLDAAHSEDARRLRAFEEEARKLRASLGGHGELAEHFLAMARGFQEKKREERDYWLSLLRYTARTHPAQTLRVEQIANPWPDLDAAALLDRAAGASSNRVRVHMIGNEYESAAIALVNLAPRDVTVRIEAGPFTGESGTKVAGHEVVELRAAPPIRRVASGIVSEDVLPVLGQGQTLRLGAGETAKVWLTFHSRKLPAGAYRSRLRIGDLTSVEAPLEVPIAVSVSAVRLPDRQTYRHNNWLYLDSIADPVTREATFDDALSHGTNTFVIPPVSFEVSADGTLGGMDSGRHDRLVEKLRGRAFFMISGTVGLVWPRNAVPEREAKDRAFAEAIRRYVAHMRSLGVGEKEWAFYIHDEPGLSGKDAVFDQWVADVKRVKAADAKAQVYANPAGGATAAMLAPLEDLIDVWQPDLHLFRADPEGLGNVFRHGQFWHYEAPGEQRELDPLGYYRMKPWISFQLGMTGGGYWVYSYSPYWFFDRSMAAEYGAVYTTESGPVTTKRWEASRDGIEDFELLTMIRETASQAGDAGKPALELLDEAVKWVTRGQEHASDISRKLHSYTPDYAMWMRYRERLIAEQERLPASRGGRGTAAQAK